MTASFLTLTKGQDQTSKSKVTDVEVSAFSECFLFLILFFCFFAKGENFLAKGNLITTVFCTWNLAHCASVDSMRSFADERVAQVLTR